VPEERRPKRLTKRAVDGLLPGEYAFCGELAGFGVRCQRRERSFIYRYRLNGRRTFVTIGVHGRPWTVETARAKAKQYAAMVARGLDPAQDKRQRATAAATVRAVADAFLGEHADAKRKPSTAREYRRLLEREVLPKLGPRRVDLVDHADVARLHHAMRHTPYQANRTLAVLSKLFAWAERRGHRPGMANPCRGLERYREMGRERFLSAEELARLGDALRALEAEGTIDPYAAAALRLLILTGARRGEILALQWGWIDAETGVARLPDSKTGKKVLHLSAPALAVLRGLPRLEDNPHVVAGRKPGAALVGLPKIWDRVRARAELNDVRLHDLRHSFASVAAVSGTSLLVIGKLLGHAQHATTFRYAHLARDPVTAAGDAVAQRIAAAMGGASATDQDPTPTLPTADPGQR
jgi:integrase